MLGLYFNTFTFDHKEKCHNGSVNESRVTLQNSNSAIKILSWLSESVTQEEPCDLDVYMGLLASFRSLQLNNDQPA